MGEKPIFSVTYENVCNLSYGLRLKLLTLGVGDNLLLPLTRKQWEQETVSHPECE